MNDIELIHQWSKERRTVSITGIHKHLIYVYFPLSGTYVLDTKINSLRARSQKARNKNPHVLWIAADIEKVRRQLWEHYNPQFREHEAAYQKHQAWLIEMGMSK